MKAKNFRNAQNKMAYAYILTPSGMSQKNLPSHLKRKQAEYEALQRDQGAGGGFGAVKVLGDGTKAGNRLQSRVPDNGI